MDERQYKEMFDEVKLSDERMANIEQAMRHTAIHRNKWSTKKVVVLATCMVMMLAVGTIVGATVAKIAKTPREQMAEHGSIITYEPNGELVYNEITPDTEEIIITINGDEVVRQVDIKKYLDEDGAVMLEEFRNKLCERIMLEIHEQGDDDESKSMTIGDGIDKYGRIYIDVKTGHDPRNESGWSFLIYGKTWYLDVNSNAEFDDNVELVEKDGAMCIRMPEKENDVVDYYKFTYKGKRYAVAAWWYKSDRDMSNGNVHYNMEIIELFEGE